MLLVRKEGTTPEFFYEQWSGPHVDLVRRRDQAAQLSQAGSQGGTTQTAALPAPSELKRYIHNYVVTRSKEAIPFDGIAESGGGAGPPTPQSIERAKAIASAPPSSDVQRHAPVFMNMDKTRMFSVQEIILKD
jgi:hypothetical protein